MAHELKAEIRALLSQDAAQAGDAELFEWLAMWGMIDPSRIRFSTQSAGEDPDPREPSTDAGDRQRRPDPEILLTNAYRIFRSRRALIAQGTVTVNDIAAAQRCHASTARRRLQSACERDALFTVRLNGRIHVPEVLLDDKLHPRPEWQPVIAALSQARLSEWAKWRWIARPNAGLTGKIAAEIIDTDPERIHSAALRRVIQSTE